MLSGKAPIDGLQINDLSIPPDDAPLAELYQTQIIGGSRAFVLPDFGRKGFVTVVQRKLTLEIAGDPAGSFLDETLTPRHEPSRIKGLQLYPRADNQKSVGAPPSCFRFATKRRNSS